MADLVARGGEVLSVPRKTLDANFLQVTFLQFKWVYRGLFGCVWCMPLSQAKHNVIILAEVAKPPSGSL